MKYAVVYLIRGKAGKYQQKLVRDIGPKFGENYMIENPLPAHVTLKSPFETKSSKKLESVLEEFSEKYHSSDIKIRGFGNFNKFVAYMNVKFSKSAFKLQKDLIKKISKLGIPANEYDKKHKPHATIAYGNTKESFDKIWNYLKTLTKPKFDLKFDNITILKKEKYWKIYKVYEIK